MKNYLVEDNDNLKQQDSEEKKKKLIEKYFKRSKNGQIIKLTVNNCLKNILV